MKEHYYSNFKGCLGTRTHLDSLDGSLASILAPPSIHVLSLSLFLSLLFHVTLSVVRGCPSEPFKFRTRLLLSRCHFISTTWTKIHGRKYSPFELTQCPRYRQLFRIHTPPPLSLSLSPLQSLNSRLVGRRKEFTSFARGTKGEEKEVEEFRARWLHRLQDKSWRCAPKLAVKGICQINFHGPMNTSLPSLNNVQADNK